MTNTADQRPSIAALRSTPVTGRDGISAAVPALLDIAAAAVAWRAAMAVDYDMRNSGERHRVMDLRVAACERLAAATDQVRE